MQLCEATRTKMNKWGKMSVNPAIKRLGFAETDRVLLLHVDDVGMCGASLDAFDDLWGSRSVTCGSVMVPCPWFRATAAWSRANPDADLGVHATLTSEWPGYRWSPVSTRDRASGLMDDEGAFHTTSAAVAVQADPAAVARELTMQIAMAREAGIPVSHFDTHMGSVMDAKFYGAFVDAALTAGLAPFALRMEAAQWQAAQYDEQSIAAFQAVTGQLVQDNVPLIDRVLQLSLKIEDDRPTKTRAMLDKLRPGHIGYALFHPALDTAEIRAICPDWRSRVADYELLAAGELRRYLEDQGFKVIGYRELQALMPKVA
jgi:predicted glycoside hydrolase/deacetylase ChbG (UPF0249 family)